MRLQFHRNDGRIITLRFDLRDKIEDLTPCIAWNLRLPIHKKYVIFNVTRGYFSAARCWGELVPTCEYKLYAVRD